MMVVLRAHYVIWHPTLNIEHPPSPGRTLPYLPRVREHNKYTFDQPDI